VPLASRPWGVDIPVRPGITGVSLGGIGPASVPSMSDAREITQGLASVGLTPADIQRMATGQTVVPPSGSQINIPQLPSNVSGIFELMSKIADAAKTVSREEIATTQAAKQQLQQEAQQKLKAQSDKMREAATYSFAAGIVQGATHTGSA
jgi:hypothetical protein